MAPSSKRQRSTVTISSETVVELSKSVLLPIECASIVPNEAKSGSLKLVPCGQTLNCWTAFYKHQLKQHCPARKVHKAQVQYACRLSNCSAKLHNALSSLKSHVEHSHMKNSPFPCPFTTCITARSPGSGKPTQFMTFSKIQDLVLHFEAQHGDLIGRAIDMHSAILLPRWDPLPPKKSMITPPPLPPSTSISPGTLFLHPIIVKDTSRFTQFRLISAPSSSLPAAHAPKYVPRRQMLQSSQAIVDDSSPPKAHHAPHDFAKFPDIEYFENMEILSPPGLLEPQTFVVQQIGESLPKHKDLVRPLPQHSWPLMDSLPPPTGIFYEALREQVYAGYAKGEGAATDP
ncbi:hypothetical protein MVEN_01846900 [Mycena venus]|uniref:C2H2-type domain-containing protein n=1 Tax=Mycena venus TaxID=2733690 RepID=A0A8H7CKN9_9AGAR|nr:hypothetical protein MVEN_01846900 [Mycena venus]